MAKEIHIYKCIQQIMKTCHNFKIYNPEIWYNGIMHKEHLYVDINISLYEPTAGKK